MRQLILMTVLLCATAALTAAPAVANGGLPAPPPPIPPSTPQLRASIIDWEPERYYWPLAEMEAQADTAKSSSAPTTL